MGAIVIGSTAIDHLFPGELGRTPKDFDLIVRSTDPIRRGENIDVVRSPALDDWVGERDRFATLNELYTLKVSHSYWELKNGSWDKHIYDLRFLKKRGATLDLQLHSLLYPVWVQLHGSKRTNLAMEAGEGEIWLAYPPAPEYSVSNYGQVRGPRGRLVGTTSTTQTKYRQFSVGGKTVLGHKLVMEAFEGPCPQGLCVRHLDGDGLNNNLNNLAYGTHEQNMQDKVAHGGNVRHEQHPLAKLTQEDAHEIRQRYLAGGETLRGLAEEFGVAKSLIWRIKEGQSWKEEPSGFFSDAVKRRFLHDSLHYTVAFGRRPIYERILRDGASVDVDPKKMWALPHEDLVRLFREEVAATALERILIPTNYRASPGAAYRWSLRRTITSLTKGRSATFIVDNFDEFAIPDDYMSRHFAKRDRLIRI